MNISELTLLLLLLSVGQSVFASQCGEKSSNYSQLGDQYFGFGTGQEMTAKEQKDLDKFVENLYGKWTFEIEETFCKGTGDNITNTEMKGDGDAVIKDRASFPLVIAMSKEFRDFAKRETLELLGLDAAFSFTVSNTRISAAQFRRIRGGILQEYVYEISKSRGRLDLSLNIYVAGLLQSIKTVEFTRR